MNNKYDYSKSFSNLVEETDVNQELAIPEETDTQMLSGVVANCDAAYLRTGPSQDHQDIDVLKAGTEIVVDGTEGSWYKVLTATGKQGYIMRKLVRLD